MIKECYLLAVIGAGEGGLPILEKAKELDYVRTLAFGMADSMGRGLADVFVETDVSNIEYVVECCKKYHADGVIGTSESVTEIAAIVADRLGLLGNDVKNGFGARDKYVMRQRVTLLNSVKQPQFDLYNPTSEYSFPVVVKALDSCGKRGVSIAHNKQELSEAVQYSKEWSTGGRVLIEEYLNGGKEYSIECLAANGLYEVIQFTEKDTSGPPHFTENGHHQPADLTDTTKERIREAVKDILKVLGINCGLAHLELKIIDDELFFIEVGARGGGDHIADTLTVRSTNFDYFKAAIDACLGLYVHQDVQNIAFTGIYFHCKNNEYLKPLFDAAKTAEWCIANTVKDNDFHDASSNVETAKTGYIIYCANHKITLDNF